MPDDARALNAGAASRRLITRVIGAAACALAAHCAQAEVRALLVGVSVYPHLPGQRLDGVINDLRLMRNVVSRLGVQPPHVTELSEAAGPARWPTRAHILQALDQLAQASAPGDWAVVYFAGHGAQVPQAPATRRAHAEDDGLDEVFLPRDTTRWVPARGVVEGAIVDDEFGQKLDAIRARGAFVWAVFDTCHAGDVTRAVGVGQDQDAAPVWRRVAGSALGIDVQPRLAPGPARPAAGVQAAGHLRPEAVGALLRRPAAQTVAFFASQADEPAAEEVFADPLEGRASRRFGVFTYHLHQTFLQQSPGSFAALAEAVEHAYQRRPFPTPQFTGDLQQSVPHAQPLRP